MKKLRKGIAVAVTVSMLLSGYMVWADDLDDQLQDAQNQAEAAKEKAGQADVTINNVLDKLHQIQAELDAANAELAQIQKQLNGVNANIQKTEAELRVAEAHLQQRQVILNQRVRNIYMHGQLNYIMSTARIPIRSWYTYFEHHHTYKTGSIKVEKFVGATPYSDSVPKWTALSRSVSFLSSMCGSGLD